ncbi:hypothetical protein EDB81DRAFT_875654 [Dactylonectria macrodidyma]|uniref:Uncharacterized protein n=1 Tax=Dactylonectria macrodidyma TaxID=307937 RepID=A0A9P9JP69_9HYPO|nr:hypothetical protein EDB81DRAFT_875654 [Dactylonectria macrodidyma]
MDGCQFVGNQDINGAVICTGIYFQWFATIFAKQLVRSETVSMRYVNALFQLAMLVALIYQTVEQFSTLYAAEAFIILTFGYGAVSTSAFGLDENSDSGFDPKHNNMTDTTPLGVIARLLIFSGFDGYIL